MTVCCGIELDPLYVDVIIRRYEAETGAAVVLADFGETFEKVAARRRHDDHPNVGNLIGYSYRKLGDYKFY